MEDLKVGLTINCRYTLEEYKGSGSFGEVWRAKDLQSGEYVAIKVYISLNKQGCEEFLAEYKIASGLVHQNLLTAEQYDVWDSRPYLTMKYCSKGSASELVGTLMPGKDDELTIWTFIRDVAAGLAYLHAQEPDPIVHQDIKPDNVLIDSDGTFLITDFGISKKVRSTMQSQSIRNTNAGATAYMAPERFSKHPNPILASDIWSLGVSIYELAEGELPFSGMGGILLKNGAEMPNLSDGWSCNLNAIMHFCLEKETWNRGRAKEVYQIANCFLEKERKVNVEELINIVLRKRKESDGKEWLTDPRATKQMIAPTENGTYVKEKEKNEERKNQDSKRIRSVGGLLREEKKVVFYFASSLISLFLIFFVFFFENDDLRDAKFYNERYSNLYNRCSLFIEKGNGYNQDTLIMAKLAFTEMSDLEEKYSSIQPEFYNKTKDLKEALVTKLCNAARYWAAIAETQKTNRGYSKSIELYRLALSLYDGEEIKAKYDKTVREASGIFIKDCKFKNAIRNGDAINGYGTPIYADAARYVFPKIVTEKLVKSVSYGDRIVILDVKYYNPAGQLMSDEMSPENYTSQTVIHLDSDYAEFELNGFGSNKPHYYSKGIYRVEIWTNGKKLFTTSFEIKRNRKENTRAILPPEKSSISPL